MENVTPEMFNLAMMYLGSTNQPIKKIKVTSKFFNYLEQTCHPVYLDRGAATSSGVIGNFTGIPVVVDDEIENEYYELEY